MILWEKRRLLESCSEKERKVIPRFPVEMRQLMDKLPEPDG